jgi:hypothetical protein
MNKSFLETMSPSGTCPTATHRKTAQVQLPIFKQGDDLGFCLSEHKTVPDALLAYAEMLAEARAVVLALADQEQLEIVQADTHFIAVEGPAVLIDELIEKGMLSPVFDDEDEDE